MRKHPRRQSKARPEGFHEYWALLVAVFADIGRAGG